ncbi:MAG TPA: divalent-cation tolerance protein CutA [Oceanithermus profundus]|uniref:Divalent-cation tolerance protein CutA n=1 Tax=Oceanithermus profundus TaxID=187137 RepID=A0A7C4V5H9_9DEIN|nr:divalent-cation tolerance protein CutA [Oceanithermus profundus]
MVRLVLITVPDELTAKRIARSLVEERLAACVNVVPGLLSVYRWEGRVHEDRELLLLAKTKDEALERLTARVQALHPYSTPEVIALPVERGLDHYLSWVEESVN